MLKRNRIDGYLRAIDDDKIREYWARQDKHKQYRKKVKKNKEDG